MGNSEWDQEDSRQRMVIDSLNQVQLCKILSSFLSIINIFCNMLFARYWMDLLVNIFADSSLSTNILNFSIS
jgi:hypothetical protein